MKRYAAAKLAALMLSTRSVAPDIEHPSGAGSKTPIMGRLHSVSAPPRLQKQQPNFCSSHRPSSIHPPPALLPFPGIF
jgi:hypothetical protein